MKCLTRVLHVPTRGRALHDLTRDIVTVVRDSDVKSGLASVFVRHTSASLVIQENADPSVLRDLQRWMDRLAPEDAAYEHDAEGPDDMPAHLRSAITRASETIPVASGELMLGTWHSSSAGRSSPWR